MERFAPKAEFTSAARNQFFGKLKPVCVEISQLALRPPEDKAANSKKLIELTQRLYGLLDGQAKYDASVLDEKIAEYVFFPLRLILKNQEQQPIRLTENTVKCLRILIQYGWKTTISKELSQQLLILLTFIVGGVPGQERNRGIPEETAIEGYRALAVLIKAAGAPVKASPLTEANIIPSLGHSISVILDGVVEGGTTGIRFEALQAIQAVYSTLKDDEVLATFFPGTVSSLSRLLSPPLSVNAQKRLLVTGLQILKVVLTTVLGDIKTRNLQNQAETAISEKSEEGKVLTPSWLKATTAQIKIALSTVLKLRTHDSDDVQKALERFCVALLDECHLSLANCSSMLVETTMMLLQKDTSISFEDTGLRDTTLYATSLQDLASIYPELTDIIKSTVYNWITSLPRLMQSSDERVKQRAVHNLLRGNELITSLRIDSSTLEDSLSGALRDSIITLILNSKTSKISDDANLDEDLWRNGSLVTTDWQPQSYRPILLTQESQRATRDDIMTLLRSIGPPAQQTKLAAEMLSYVRDSQGVDQISSYWLSFELLKAAFSHTSDVDSFLDFSAASISPEDQDSVFEELYSFSVSILASHSDASDIDWRLEAIALEVTAFAASRVGSDFKPELIDVLYPVATFLGSQSSELRNHAITTLNSVAAYCGYSSVSELIIDNADYMVNSVSLRLNTFDISPASTKVLTMMIRLTGPRLIPYLDDVVAAMFAALDNYHGYHGLVESLFAVLSEVVEQGVKSDTLLLEGAQRHSHEHRKQRPEATRLEDVVAVLDSRVKRRRQDEDDDVEEIIRSHPKEPWKPAAEELDAIQKRDQGEEENEEPEHNEVEKAAPGATPTYNLLTRVTTLTQHYLTSPTPTLRKQLLDLLSKVSPALAPDENAFLPLVNAIWPVVIPRLHDGEPYVVIAACKALGSLCESAGDFLSSRIKTEWGDSLGKWCLKVRDDATRSSDITKGANISKSQRKAVMGGASENSIAIPIRTISGDMSTQLVSSSKATTVGLGRFAQAAQIWDAVVELLTAIVSYVRIDDDIYDQILEILGDKALYNEAVRNALEAVNADAVWYAMYERGSIPWMPTPELEGIDFFRMEKVQQEGVLRS